MATSDQNFGMNCRRRLQDHHHHHNMNFGIFHGGETTSFMSHSTLNGQEGSSSSPAFEFGELEEAIVLQGVKKIKSNDEAKDSLYAEDKGEPTLEMFPSWPARFHLSSPMRGGSSRSGGEDSSDSGCFGNRTEDTESPPLSTTFDHSQHHQLPLAAADMAAATHPALPPNSKHPSQHKLMGTTPHWPRADISVNFQMPAKLPARLCAPLVIPARLCAPLVIPARLCAPLVLPARPTKPSPSPTTMTCGK